MGYVFGGIAFAGLLFWYTHHLRQDRLIRLAQENVQPGGGDLSKQHTVVAIVDRDEPDASHDAFRNQIRADLWEGRKAQL